MPTSSAEALSLSARPDIEVGRCLACAVACPRTFDFTGQPSICMRRMYTFTDSAFLQRFRAVLHPRSDAGVATVTGPCALHSEPTVSPSCASSYHRRAPTLLHQRLGSRPHRFVICNLAGPTKLLSTTSSVDREQHVLPALSPA